LRLFAGPNGSGKSSVFSLIATQYQVGAYVSADELRRMLETSAGVRLSHFLPTLSSGDFESYYSGHPLRALVDGPFPFVACQDGRLTLSETSAHSPKLAYAIAILVDFLLTRLVEAGADVSLETGFQYPSEVELMQRARTAGYRIYVYYVCVATPEISKQRVALRVTQGGRGVPDADVVEQYERSLASLKEVVSLSDRAYLFDNTYSGASLKLEILSGTDVTAHEPVLPGWLLQGLPALVPQ
jgi:predicted ABC-type ATPase